MAKETQYVVVVTYDFAGLHDTKFIGAAETWNRAFWILETYNYEAAISENLTGTWAESSGVKWIEVSEEGRPSFHESHFFTNTSDFSEDTRTCAILHIFET